MIELTIILFHVILFAVLLNGRVQMLFYFPCLFNDIFGLISITLIENGAYISEQNVYGYNNGAFLIFYAFCLASMCVFYILSKGILVKIRRSNTSKLFWVATGLFVSLLIYVILDSPNFNRFTVFWGKGELFEKFGNYLLYAYAACYFYSVIKDDSNKRSFWYLVAYIITLLMRGEEFGGIFFAVYAFFFGFLLRLSNENASLPKSINIRRALLFSVVVVIGAVLYKYYQIPDERFFFRIVNQAHLFWGAINLSNQFPPAFNFDYFAQNFFKFSANSQTIEYGLGELMYAVSGDFAKTFLEEGARFSGGYPSVLIFNFGLYCAMLINIAILAMYYVICKIKMLLIDKYNAIVFIFFIKLAAPFEDLFFVGQYSNLNIKTLTLISLAFFIFIVSKKYTRCLYQTDGSVMPIGR